MQRHTLGFLFVALVLCLATGCGINDANPLNTVAQLATAPTAPIGNASVRVALRVSPDLPETARATLRAATGSSTTVLFRLVIIDTQAATATFREKSVTVTAGEIAEATFDNIPTRPVVAQVQINGGNIAGYKDFQGGEDLVAGENRIVCAPAGSNTRSDMVARVMLAAVSDTNILRTMPTQLAQAARQAVQSVDLTSETARENALNKLVEQSSVATGLVRLGLGTDSTTIRGTASGTASWTRTMPELMSGADLFGNDLSGLYLERVVRHGLNGVDGIVALRHQSQPAGVIVRLNSEGNRAAYCRNPGPLFTFVVLPNGQIIAGGFHYERRCPVVFAWNPQADGRTTTTAGGNHNLVWERFFTDYPATEDEPTAGVTNMTFDGRDTLVCAVRDARNRLVRYLRVNVNTGEILPEPPATPIPVVVPDVSIASPSVGAVFAVGTPVNIVASAAISSGTVREVRFFIGPRFVATRSTPPYIITLPATLTAGIYEARAAAISDAGILKVSEPAIFELINPTASPTYRTFTINNETVVKLTDENHDDMLLRVWRDDTATEPTFVADPPQNDFREYADRLGQFTFNIPASHPLYMFHIKLTHWVYATGCESLEQVTEAYVGHQVLLRGIGEQSSGQFAPCMPLQIKQSQAKNVVCMGAFNVTGGLYRIVAFHLRDMTQTGFLGQQVPYRVFTVDMSRLPSAPPNLLPPPDPTPALVAPEIARMAGVLGNAIRGVPSFDYQAIYNATKNPVWNMPIPQLSVLEEHNLPYMFPDFHQPFNATQTAWRMLTEPDQLDGRTNVYTTTVRNAFGARPFIYLYRNNQFVTATETLDEYNAPRWKFATQPEQLKVVLDVNKRVMSGTVPTVAFKVDLATDLRTPLRDASDTYLFKTVRPGSLVINDWRGENQASLVVDEVELSARYSQTYDRDTWRNIEQPIATGSFRMSSADPSHPYRVVGTFDQNGLIRAVVFRGTVEVGTLTREAQDNSMGQWVYTDKATQFTARNGIGFYDN